jgi:hypothetical protein
LIGVALLYRNPARETDSGLSLFAMTACQTGEITMRRIMLSLLAVLVLVSPAIAQEHATALPEIVIGSPPSAPVKPGGTGNSSAKPDRVGNSSAKPDGCAEVEIGSSRAMDCLNQKLKNKVDSVNPVMNVPPIDARSPDTKVGVVNIPGVQQQYGKNFGVSAVPFRPAPPVFSSSLHR